MSKRSCDYHERGKKAGRSRRMTIEKMREGIMILNCTVWSQEKCSEGEFLDAYINILNRQRKAYHHKPVWHECYPVGSPKGENRRARKRSSLQDWLKNASTSTIHISAHGPPDEYKGPTYLMAGNSPFTIDDLKVYGLRRKKNLF